MIPRELYETERDAITTIELETMVNEEMIGWAYEKIIWGDGIRCYVKGADFPMKGYAPNEAVYATNIVKRLILKGLPLVNPLRGFETILTNFTDIAWKAMASYILQYKYLTHFAQETHDICFNFATSMGIEEKTASQFAKIMAHIFEYDKAYYFRLQDLAMETSKEQLLESPRTELSRLLTLNHQRESQHGQMVSKKFQTICAILTSAILIPKVNQAFRKAISESNFDKLKMDDSDRYWAFHREDYLFLGLTYPERVALIENAGFKICHGERYRYEPNKSNV